MLDKHPRMKKSELPTLAFLKRGSALPLFENQSPKRWSTAALQRAAAT
jgi:hypothetical protein